MEKKDLKYRIEQTGLTVLDINVGNFSIEEIEHLCASIESYLEYHYKERECKVLRGRVSSPVVRKKTGEKVYKNASPLWLRRYSPGILVWCAIEDVKKIQEVLSNGSIWDYSPKK